MPDGVVHKKGKGRDREPLGRRRSEPKTGQSVTAESHASRLRAEGPSPLADHVVAQRVGARASHRAAKQATLHGEGRREPPGGAPPIQHSLESHLMQQLPLPEQA